MYITTSLKKGFKRSRQFTVWKRMTEKEVLQIYNVFDFEDFQYFEQRQRYKGKDESRRSETEIVRNVYFCKFSILPMINLELDRN